ncbi:MAG TPA: OmpA family protein [Phnomibacter sp.]|nr:OmpA family protein [Phnomibacter sp.]
MKSLAVAVVVLLSVSADVQAQLMNKMKDKVMQKVDKAADNALNKPAGDNKPATSDQPKEKPTQEVSSKKDISLYANYDFVPGDEVLFSDDMLEDELDEIPVKWLVDRGRAEVAERDGEKMIAARGATTLRPRMKEKSYLPARFTIEFDMKHLNFNANYGRKVELRLANPGADGNPDAGVFAQGPISVWADAQANFMEAEGKWPFSVIHDVAQQAVMREWKHVAIAVNERSVKVYVNQHRILNAAYEFGKPSSVMLTVTQDYEAPVLIKNFRIMAGGKNPAKQVTTGSVYIARGIQFQKASSQLLPESMGEINGLVKLMKDDPSLKFEIGGHTSAEGGESAAQANQVLSEQRARVVRDKMMEMGIDGKRLEAKGYGQTKPIGANDSPEGRAINRRVEFVKKN